jgi:hypothetical protein
LVVVKLKLVPTRGKARKRGLDQHAIDSRTGEYDGAMRVVRQALAELEAARTHNARTHNARTHDAPPATFRQAHARIDEALARAAAAAADVHTSLFEAAGGMHHAEVNPAVIVWKRRLNTALTLRSQHLMAQVDEEAAVPIAGAFPGNRAAYGPHQAGLDFDSHGDESPAAAVDLDVALSPASLGSTT